MLYKIFLLCLFLLALPVIVLLSVLITFLQGFPLIFRQNRIGKNGEIFVIYKFRTMVHDAEIRKLTILNKNESDGPVFKIKEDPRYTQVGKFLAHTGMDELPQLWNVLRGDMALIGPRPLPVDEAKQLKPWQQKRHSIKPGIISPWILQGYHQMKFDEWMKSDIEYVERKSFISDLVLSMQACKFLSMLFFKEIAQYLGVR